MGRSALIESRFWSFVEKTDKCWEWKGALSHNGYGRFKFQGKTHRAHRVSFYLDKGVWPSWLVLHSCDNPKCVRPDHLREGDQSDNMSDRKLRTGYGQNRGEINGASKLNAVVVREIYSSEGSCKSVAETHGVSASTVSMIRTGKTWRHVTQH